MRPRALVSRTQAEFCDLRANAPDLVPSLRGILLLLRSPCGKGDGNISLRPLLSEQGAGSNPPLGAEEEPKPLGQKMRAMEYSASHSRRFQELPLNSSWELQSLSP